MDFNESHSDSSRSVPGSNSTSDQHVEDVNDVDGVRTINGFEDAAECPNCEFIRPFGADCPRCGWEPERNPNSTDEDSSPSLSRVAFVVATGETTPIATAKATAALSNQFNNDGSRFDLVEEFDDPTQLFPKKWGDLGPALEVGSDQGAAVLEQVRTTLTRPDLPGGSEDSPLLYGELGGSICTEEELETALDGGSALVLDDSEETVWLVPVVIYEAPSEGSRDGHVQLLDCNHCDGDTKHVFQGESAGATEADDRPEENIWVCNVCNTGRYAPPPAE